MSGAVSKIAAERNQKALLDLALKSGNDTCADCKTRNPRWASYNLGIFICVNCASVHRKIGTHVSKVKSLTMDVWSKEQVEHMRQVGNVKSNEIYNPDEVRHPPPANMIDVGRDSDLEKFIRDKYEFKRFVSRIDRSAIVASHLGPSRSATSVKSRMSSSPSPVNSSRSQTLPASKPSLPPATSAPVAPTRAPASTTMNRSASQPIPPPSQVPQPLAASVWSDLASLQGSTQTSTLPLQYMSPTSSEPVATSHLSTGFPPGGTSLGTNFALASSNIGLASQGASLLSSASPGAGNLGQSAVTPSVQSPFALGATVGNPFTRMAVQTQAQPQAQQSQFPSASPFGTSLPQQPTFAPQVQQPTFSQSVTNPFFNTAAQPQNTLSPQQQAPQQTPFMQTTPSPVPFTGSPFQQPAQSPYQQYPLFQQPTQSPFQPHPPQFGSVQPSGGPVAGSPFTSWLTQPPNGLAGAHVGQGSVNGQWGSM